MIGTGMALLAVGLASAGTTAVVAHKSANAQERASRDAVAAELEGTRVSTDFLREKDAKEEARWERAYNQGLADHRARETRMAPYRAVGAQSARTLGSLMTPPTARAAAKPIRLAAQPMAKAPAPGAPQPGSARMVFDPKTGRIVPAQDITTSLGQPA